MEKKLIEWVLKIVEMVYSKLMENPKLIELMLRRNPTIRIKLGKINYKENREEQLDKTDGEFKYNTPAKQEEFNMEGMEIEITSNLDGTKVD